ncbi:hypothetical protein CEXT_307621 [Caerostris extrusa]|uniref:Uncharacterized protein n=1 Tax=Caerostris extrusa TaxID=172846 RepID=A0AAV4WHW7_CAEEX|nr:hypothetical protein CEXT_307621 [Caerostris extrusa]
MERSHAQGGHVLLLLRIKIVISSAFVPMACKFDDLDTARDLHFRSLDLTVIGVDFGRSTIGMVNLAVGEIPPLSTDEKAAQKSNASTRSSATTLPLSSDTTFFLSYFDDLHHFFLTT